MSNNKEQDDIEFNSGEECRLERDPKTGILVLVGPPMTKEKVARDFPDDSDRDAKIIRRSVGL